MRTRMTLSAQRLLACRAIVNGGFALVTEGGNVLTQEGGNRMVRAVNRLSFGGRERELGYATLRLAIGMSMLIHGVVRLPKIPAFATETMKMFAGSWLPAAAVGAFARVTPFVEFAIGVSVLLGLATKWGLTLGGLWMVPLIFGSTLIEKYDIVGIQLVYSLVFFHLLLHLRHNALSLDAWMSRCRRASDRSTSNSKGEFSYGQARPPCPSQSQAGQEL